MSQIITKVSKLKFNPAPSLIMHLDINSAFASIEQQFNPQLRSKPVAVAAYPTAGGCILAASIEAKTYGVKTGMRVGEGLKLCPSLMVLTSTPNLYRRVHRQMYRLLKGFCDVVVPKSIDEFVLDFGN